jgi:RNA polymerase sigma-70 factor (ECF subfamily)
MTRTIGGSALDDEALGEALQRCAGRDRAALRMIYDSEAGRMLGVARRMLRRPSLAEEVVQDVFVQVWLKAASFDPARGNARGWLYAILRYRALNILRGEAGVDLVADFEPMALVSDADRPDEMMTRLSEGGRLRRCLEQLGPSRRDAILLAYGRGMSHGELAGTIGVPLGTAKSWIRRSLAALRECMG